MIHKLTNKVAGLNLPHTSPEDKLNRILASALKSNKIVDSDQKIYQYWNSNFFNLNQVQLFRDATLEEQIAILALVNQGLLEEAYFIEKAGMGYMAKMVMLAESTEERMLYALFSADEATHLATIFPFLPHSESVEIDDPFLQFLADLVETQDKVTICFVIQVVLEGWGLSHYKLLARNCLDSNLSQMFQGFLAEEARHHATGVTLFNQMLISQASQEAIVEVSTLFLRMVQMGPQRVVSAVEKVKGHLSKIQKIKLFEELDTQTHSATRLALLRSLMYHGKGKIIVQELEQKEMFVPLPAVKCVDMM